MKKKSLIAAIVALLAVGLLLPVLPAAADECRPEVALDVERDEDGEYEMGMEITFTLGGYECEKQRADIAKAKAEIEKTKIEVLEEEEYINRQRIYNLKEILEICEEKWIESLCSRLEEFGANIEIK